MLFNLLLAVQTLPKQYSLRLPTLRRKDLDNLVGVPVRADALRRLRGASMSPDRIAGKERPD